MPAELERRISSAGKIILENVRYFSENLGKVESLWKADKTRVTKADLHLSRTILKTLAANFPEDDLVSEEDLPAADQPPRPLRKRFCWVLDPIDGTNNYAAGLPLCGILLALLENGNPIYGWTYEHIKHRLIEGGPNHGLKLDGVPFQPPPQPPELGNNSFVSLHFPLSKELLTRLAPLLSHATGRCLGSSAIHYAYNALGTLDGSFACRCKVWDVAAGHALLAAAGRRIVFLPTNPFPLTEISANPPTLVNLAGTEAFLRFTLPLFANANDEPANADKAANTTNNAF